MQESTGNAKCIWSGKRLCALALGHAKVLAKQVQDAMLPRLTEALVQTPRGLAGRALEILQEVKNRWQVVLLSWPFCIFACHWLLNS